MFCKYCGNQISNDSSFCKYCGNQLAKSATTQTTEQSTNNKPQTTQQHIQTTKSSAQNTHSPTQKSTTSSGTGFAKFLIFALFCFIAYIVYTNSTESENFSSGGSVRQHIYIDNTYEAFAAASVGDWYIDINDGNKPKQVTQGDIDWSQQKLREQGKTLPTKKSTSTTTTASKKATVATSNCDFVQKNGNTATAMFSFPSAGQYTVNVFQKRNGGESNFCGEFLVNASSGSNVHFAKTFSNYGEKANGTVLSPIRSPIQRGSTQTFSVHSNKNSVAVIIDGNWTYLSRNSKGIYTGRVSIPYGASVVKVSVGDKRGETHWSLAEYEVR